MSRRFAEAKMSRDESESSGMKIILLCKAQELSAPSEQYRYHF